MPLLLVFFLVIFSFLGTSIYAQNSLLTEEELKDQLIYLSLENALSNPDKVYKLNLALQDLVEVPNSIAKLKNLQQLWLGGNELTTLPESIIELRNLQLLDAYGNKITALPEGFEALQNLEVLDLGSNKFKGVPAVVYKLENLKEFRFYNNKLKKLDDEITSLDSLEVLRLGINKIRKLPDNFGELSKLEELYLPNNRLRKLPNSFADLENLATLDLSYNRFWSIPEEIDSNAPSESAEFWRRGISKKSRTAIREKYPNTNWNFYPKYEGGIWGLHLAFQQGKESVLEAGILRAFRKDFILFGGSLSAEYNLNGDMWGLKAGGWVNAFVHLGLHAVYYQTDLTNSFGIRPEIGWGAHFWDLSYGFNALIGDSDQNINRHMVNFRVTLPFSPLMSPFR